MYDPYSVLGLARSASEDEVKQAFRTLAKRFHPDTPEGASDKGRRFKDLSIAYEILGDAKKRRAYDRGEIDAHGNPRAGYTPRPEPEAEEEPVFDLGETTFADPPPRSGTNGPHRNGEAASTAFRSAFEKAFGGSAPPNASKKDSRVEDLFSEFFSDRTGTKKPSPGKGVDTHFELQITFEEAMLGGNRRVKMPDGKRFDVRIPIGVRDGQTIRLKGQGEAALAHDEPGDALITVAIEPHPYFRRDGHDILLNLPITLGEALHGARVDVPTLHGPVSMNVPAGTNSGQVMRVKGKGMPAHSVMPAGDLLVTLQIVLPEQADQNLSDVVKRWEAAHPYDPRRKLGGV